MRTFTWGEEKAGRARSSRRLPGGIANVVLPEAQPTQRQQRGPRGRRAGRCSGAVAPANAASNCGSPAARGQGREGAQAARVAAPGFPQGMTSRRRAAIGCAAASSPFMDTSPARGSPCRCRAPLAVPRRRSPRRSRGRPARSGPPRPAGELRARGGRPPALRPSPSVPGRRRVWAEPRERSAEEPRW